MIDQAPDTWHDAPGRAYGEVYTPAPKFLTKEDADAKAVRSFWRGITIGLSLTPVIGALAVAVALVLA